MRQLILPTRRPKEFSVGAIPGPHQRLYGRFAFEEVDLAVEGVEERVQTCSTCLLPAAFSLPAVMYHFPVILVTSKSSLAHLEHFGTIWNQRDVFSPAKPSLTHRLRGWHRIAALHRIPGLLSGHRPLVRPLGHTLGPLGLDRA